MLLFTSQAQGGAPASHDLPPPPPVCPGCDMKVPLKWRTEFQCPDHYLCDDCANRTQCPEHPGAKRRFIQ